jgi:hypothetical protein
MKIPLTSRKKLATLKAAALLPEFEVEEDANWPEYSEEAATAETLLETPSANAPAAKLDFNE